MESNPIIENSWSGLYIPKDVVTLEETDQYGRFSLGPLEPGYATFLGNSLRRVLISSLHGAAIMMIRIPDVRHEFSSIPNVLEDVTTLILNLKKVRFRYQREGHVQLHLNVTAPAGESFPILAKDIMSDVVDDEGNPLVEILNPNHQIATLNGGTSFEMDMWIDSDYGYKGAGEQRHKLADGNPVFDLEPEKIFVDASYRLVSRVNFRVYHTKVNGNTNYERLEIEIDGDGSISPRDALAYSAKILKEQMNIFVYFKEEFEEYVEIVPVETEYLHNPNLYRQVDELELSVRSSNCLKSANITYIGELVQKTDQEMLKTKNFGRKSLRELKEILSSMNLQLGMKIEGWTPNGLNK
jgi:DNA-directed RNA polymerase subunit alpha